MGKVTFTNITVGEGKLFVGANGTTVDSAISTDGDDSIYNVGATQEGVSISWEPDMVDIEVDQFGDAARVIQSKQKVMVKTTLAEATLQNLAHAWGANTNVQSNVPGLQTGWSTNTTGIYGTFNMGLQSVYPAEKYLRIEGNAPGSTSSAMIYRTYKCNRAVQYSASEFSLQRAENVKFSVEFRVLPDPTKTGAEYGTIVDRADKPYTKYF